MRPTTQRSRPATAGACPTRRGRHRHRTRHSELGPRPYLGFCQLPEGPQRRRGQGHWTPRGTPAKTPAVGHQSANSPQDSQFLQSPANTYHQRWNRVCAGQTHFSAKSNDGRHVPNLASFVRALLRHLDRRLVERLGFRPTDGPGSPRGHRSLRGDVRRAERESGGTDPGVDRRRRSAVDSLVRRPAHEEDLSHGGQAWRCRSGGTGGSRRTTVHPTRTGPA